MEGPVHHPIHIPHYTVALAMDQICRIWLMFRPTSHFWWSITVNSMWGQDTNPISINFSRKVHPVNWRYCLTSRFLRLEVSRTVMARQSYRKPSLIPWGGLKLTQSGIWVQELLSQKFWTSWWLSMEWLPASTFDTVVLWATVGERGTCHLIPHKTRGCHVRYSW